MQVGVPGLAIQVSTLRREYGASDLDLPRAHVLPRSDLQAFCALLVYWCRGPGMQVGVPRLAIQVSTLRREYGASDRIL